MTTNRSPRIAPRIAPRSSPRISRRTVLRGLGAAIALPWLESLACGGSTSTVRSIDQPPLRYGSFLWANGVNAEHWWARGEGPAMELSPTLAPLEACKRDLLVIDGLHVYNNTSGPHWPLFSNYLSGVQFEPSLIPQGGESIDQCLARHLGAATPVPNLVLAVEPAEHGLRGGVPAVYYSTVSWTSKNTPVPPEIYPRAVFDRLFNTAGLKRDRSVLDVVRLQARAMRRQLAGQDRHKLDEFLHSVRDLEKRIDRAAKDERLEGWRPSLAVANLPRPPAELPQDVADHMRMMLDLVVLAFQMDRTRIATLLFNRDVSHMRFGFLDGVANEELHGISHHKNQPDKLAWYQRINQFHIEQFAYFVRRLAAIEEAPGVTLLDNVILTCGSNMRNGDNHDGRDLPLIVAGRGGGSIRTGRVLDFRDRPEAAQRFCNLHLAVAQKLGVPLTQFGDSTGPMTELE